MAASPALSDDQVRQWSERLESVAADFLQHCRDIVHASPDMGTIWEISDEGTVRLKEPRCTDDVLRAVRAFMNEALRTKHAGNTNDGLSSQTIATTPPVAAPVYESLSLSAPLTQIRLIHLLPGADIEPIRTRLTVHDSIHSESFEALSYVWGTRGDQVPISVNGYSFDVTANLGLALRCLRLADTARVLWIDALCINQNNDTEKSAQVSIMGQIYKSAKAVLVFLGDGNEGSNMVMDYLQSEDAMQLDGDLPGATSEKSLPETISRLGFDQLAFLQAAHHFFLRPWWSRTWVAQEYALARDEPIWYCGKRPLSLTKMRQAFAKLWEYVRQESTPFQGQPSFIDYMASHQFHLAEQAWNVSQFLAPPPTNEGKRFRWDPKLSNLLMVNMFRSCSDSRDRVYSLRDLSDAVTRDVFLPDYSISPREVFEHVAAFCLTMDWWPNMFWLFPLGNDNATPSWVPNFNSPLNPTHSSVMRTIQGTPSWATKTKRTAIYRGLLHVSGVVLDTVDTVFNIGPETGIGAFERIWRLEGELRTAVPRIPLPKSVVEHVPDHCILPFKNEASGCGASSLSTIFPTTGKLPNYLLCQILAMQMVHTAVSTRPGAEMITCDKWKESGDGMRYVFGMLAKWGRILTLAINPDDENMVSGAVFDFENMRSTINSVDLETSEPASGVSHLTSTESNPPKYKAITAALSQLGSEQDLAWAKTMLLRLAGIFRSAVIGAIEKAGTFVTSTLVSTLGSKAQTFWVEYAASYEKVGTQCTCLGDDKEQHLDVVRTWLEKIERCRLADEECIAALNPAHTHGMHHATDVFRAVLEQLSGFVTTRRGFFGIINQTDHGIRAGDIVAGVNGCETTFILAVDEAEGEYKMKSTIAIAHLENVDIDKVTDLGIFRKECFKIR